MYAIWSQFDISKMNIFYTRNEIAYSIPFSQLYATGVIRGRQAEIARK